MTPRSWSCTPSPEVTVDGLVDLVRSVERVRRALSKRRGYGGFREVFHGASGRRGRPRVIEAEMPDAVVLVILAGPGRWPA